ncbi:uroplakin-2 isoform X2 [Alligator sinensis]|uniref:Uroplakin-2 isoform X2 n=1 Tax=Alligator sinensis TaxID=38654 RepID=A0A3Q0FRA6_ALLSI|nr:uroplakin-2 isoform X2 [Alligator sinensis]
MIAQAGATHLGSASSDDPRRSDPGQHPACCRHRCALSSALAMQALAVLTFCAFFGGTKMADFNISSVSGVLSPALAESLLMAVPPCQFTGANASIHIIHPNGTTDVRHFTVPLCRGRRELVSVVDSTGGFTVTRLDAYQITRLTPGHTYTISYSVFNKDRSVSKSNSIAMGTLNRVDYRSIPADMSRSGGMVVITVLLSIAMFVLVAGLIAMLAITRCK